MSEVNIVDSLLEVNLVDKESFLKIKETLQRIGVASRKEKALYQSCHILHKKGKYYIVHFKEMFALDGRPTNFDETDKSRRNRIAKLLEEWGLIKIVNQTLVENNMCSMNQIKVIRFEDKNNWDLVSKYSVGRKKVK